MGPYILMIGLIVNDMVVPVHDVSGTPFATLGHCEETINHPMVRTSYMQAFPEHDVRLWCEPVLSPLSVQSALNASRRSKVQ